ncbi:hypothetical protein D0869_05788 [Hortaea werneckii]|uniref:Intradiol ring-cleavage dioxygenases domain-containing protein n=1 Tax=Hortaea werneckii TaxID=91943 RepID=A0A3M6WX23_HORWE|nr:hypothetical protein KC324_g11633 [Hortaea werneckii]KAI7573703.1 hypothetical protein KC316_g11730 [Hortaea werneckii]RMX82798.1 hypothetical protein D0869_05788 [Hortaea werneckii]
MQFFPQTLLGLLALTSTGLGHGKPESYNQALFRRSHEEHVRRSLSACGDLSKRDVDGVHMAKKEEHVARGAARVGLESEGRLAARDIVNTGSNSSCVLTPTDANGSLIREDTREDEPGFPLLLTVQVTDVRTCEPIEGVALDFWNANSTGVYSNMEAEDTLGETQLRGISITDKHGLAQTLTIFPGWYAGRAQHMHVKAHVNYTIYLNDTISFGNVPYTGQMFFDQDSLTAINANWPYTEDTTDLTLNADDHVITGQQNTTWYDPFVELRTIGYNVTAGFLGYINFAIDPTAEPADAASGSGGGMGGDMPSGAALGSGSGMPSGTAIPKA